jgi:hypothetical protein
MLVRNMISQAVLILLRDCHNFSQVVLKLVQLPVQTYLQLQREVCSRLVILPTSIHCCLLTNDSAWASLPQGVVFESYGKLVAFPSGHKCSINAKVLVIGHHSGEVDVYHSQGRLDH